jgi:cell division protein FtsB
MPHLSPEYVLWERILYIAAGAVVLYLGFRLGKLIGTLASSRLIAQKEQELFTAQKGFKTLYENELAALREENAKLQEQVKTMTAKVEEYRKKAAGLGGLFNAGG